MSDGASLDPSALALLRRVGGEVLVRRMIRLFLETAPQRLADARAGQRSGDLEAVRRAAHSLKSSAAQIGAPSVSGAAGRLERAAEERQAGEVADLLADLETSWGSVKAAMEGQPTP